MTMMQGSARPYSCYVPSQRVAHDLSERQRRVLALLEVNRSGLALREVRSELGVGGMGGQGRSGPAQSTWVGRDGGAWAWGILVSYKSGAWEFSMTTNSTPIALQCAPFSARVAGSGV